MKSYNLPATIVPGKGLTAYGHLVSNHLAGDSKAKKKWNTAIKAAHRIDPQAKADRAISNFTKKQKRQPVR